MQTFLPYEDFTASAHTLDWQRLGKQRGEAKQILNTLLGRSAGWQHHPAVLMWSGYERTLCYYGEIICVEWRNRGFNDSTYFWFLELAAELRGRGEKVRRPPWLGDEAFHRAHQSNLVRKNPEHYSPLFPGVPDNLPYVWPVRTHERPHRDVVSREPRREGRAQDR